MKLHCYKCEGSKNVNILHNESLIFGDPDEYRYTEIHYLVQCKGCDAVFYAITAFNEDDFDPQTGEPYASWQLYPQSENQRKPIESEYFPQKIKIIYNEIIHAINVKLPILAGIGLRALIEAICKDKKIKGDNLESLINGMAQEGVLSKVQADILHSHRYLGNSAAHEVIKAKSKELVAALEIAETVLKTIYILPELSKEITTGNKK